MGRAAQQRRRIKRERNRTIDASIKAADALCNLDGDGWNEILDIAGKKYKTRLSFDERYDRSVAMEFGHGRKLRYSCAGYHSATTKQYKREGITKVGGHYIK